MSDIDYIFELAESHKALNAAGHEIEALRAEKAAWQGIQEGTAAVVKQLEAELKALRAENARLQKALGYFTARETPTQWLYRRDRAEELARNELDSAN